MATRTAFLVQSQRILPVLLSVICLLVPAEAQHGGGGGHSGGGHFGGGHSSGMHSAGSQGRGHFGWLHFWSGKHSSRHAESGSSSISDVSPYGPSHLGNFATLASTTSVLRAPSTLLWSPPLVHAASTATISFVSSTVGRHRGFFSNRFPRFSSSGCFLNSVSQVCFFEPFLPLLSFSGYFDPLYFGFGEDSLDLGDGLNSQGPGEAEISTIPPAANPSDDDTAEGNSSALPGATFGVVTERQALGNGVFLLVLTNGTSHAVTDYWVEDGYLEYISRDGARGHIPLEALDLQNTVTQNAPRGLPFVLRFAPAENR
ncbi:MAG: hypothetical protein WB762_01400 [Candidatus Sulfotelmatobacter sp.]